VWIDLALFYSKVRVIFAMWSVHLYGEKFVFMQCNCSVHSSYVKTAGPCKYRDLPSDLTFKTTRDILVTFITLCLTTGYEPPARQPVFFIYLFI